MDTFNLSTSFFLDGGKRGYGSSIFLKNSVQSTSFILKHVQIECLQEPETAICRCYTKQMFLKVLQIQQENTCVGVFSITLQSLLRLQLLQKEIPTQVFSWEICGIFKHTFFYRTTLLKTEE